MSDEKNYDPEMRGILYAEERQGDSKFPIATGKVTISGVELRIAMWPSRVTAGEKQRKYWPIKVEYKQGTTRFLVPVMPADVIAKGVAVAEVPAAASAPSASVAVAEDIPF